MESIDRDMLRYLTGHGREMARAGRAADRRGHIFARPMTFQYRPQQLASANATEEAWRRGHKRVLDVLCVGSGKSIAMAELARRAWQRGERTLTLVHRPELATQDKAAHDTLGVPCGLNSAKLDQRVWRAPSIVAMINSVYRNAQSFGRIDNILIDECHTIPFSEAGMYREFLRAFPDARVAGFTGTPFRLQGGSLDQGEGALFEIIVYTYDIIDGIRDGYLVPAFSAPAVDKVDVTKLKKTAGEYTGASQDAQTIALMDSHISQMLMGGADRRAWLIFEASQKAALAMAERLNAWGVPAGVVIDKTKNRADIIRDFNSGRLRALVNVETLTTGFDSQRIDLVCFRRRTMSLGLYIQMCGRGLRTIGGNIQASIAAGKADCLYYDFAGLIDQHGPLDFIRPKETKVRLTSCDSCGARCPSAAARCWKCDAVMTKNCPACLTPVAKGTLDCPHCGFDMRAERGEAAPAKLFDVPSGAALIASWKTGSDRSGGWCQIRKAWQQGDVATYIDVGGEIGCRLLPETLAPRSTEARWARFAADGAVEALLLPNGASRTSARQVTADGAEIIVPLPAAISG